jgi:hypothetical protein
MAIFSQIASRDPTMSIDSPSTGGAALPEEAADVTPEADLRLPRAEITLCRRLGRDQLLAAD